MREQNTQDSERELRLHRRIFETSLDLILVTDQQGTFIEVSPSAKAILGYNPSDMVSRSGLEFIHPDDLEATRNEMRLARRGQDIRNFDTRYLHKDGHTVILSWTGVWSEPEKRHFFIGRDMTARKQLEAAEHDAKEALAAIIDASPVAIICLDSNRVVRMWSRAAEQIFGYSAEETLGRPYALVPLGGEAQYDALFARALAGEVLRDVRVRRRRKDGVIIDISFDAAIMHAANDTAIAYALTDITDRLKLEQQLRHAQKMDAIGQLTGGVAHDFNNILTVITGTIDILAHGVRDRPELAAIAKLIGDAATRGAEMTSRLLAFARRQPLQPRTMNVNQLIEDAASLLKSTLGEHIDIDWKLRDDAWPVMIDPEQLTTALLNLAVNARDAMPEGGKLTLESANVELDEAYAQLHGEVVPGPYVMVAVSDTGSGISEAIREKVFEPFFTTKDMGKGTGLGLSMVYGFVKQSGGHIKVYSEEGHGTAFKIYLPRSGNADGVQDDRATQVNEGGNETILVVEDDPGVRASVSVQLQHLGYKIIVAESAVQALQTVDAGVQFDLLFTDVVMPGPMNGRQLADEVEKRRKGTKVLYTSGYTENSIVHHGRLDAGVFLLPKPYRKSDLAHLVRQALSGSAGNPR